MEFGFYPKPLEVDAGPIKVRSLPDFDKAVNEVASYDRIENGWLYVPSHRYGDRVFGLPKTHVLEHAKATGEDHVDFHIWTLSFFLGMRLTTTERGFLDATPVELRKLIDFDLSGDNNRVRAIELTERFWRTNRRKPRNAQRLKAAIHALFLGRYPQALQFERFIYLYTAIDACYALAKSLRRPKDRHKHYERIGWMCREFGVTNPSWAEDTGASGTVVSALRNNTLHEALFGDEPLGFDVYGAGTGVDITFEMSIFVCRLLVALLGGEDSSYVSSSVHTGQTYFLSLTK